MSSIRYINVYLETFGGIISLIFILSVHITRPKKVPLEKFYIGLLSCNMLLLFCDAIAGIFKGNTSYISFFLVWISNFLAFVLGYIMLMVFTYYLVEYLKEANAKVSRIRINIMNGIMITAILLVIISQFNHMYYIIDENNIYHRQQWFWFSQMLGIIGMILNGQLLYHFRYCIKRRDLINLSIYICLPVLAMVFQIIFYSIAVLYLATTICLLTIYISLQQDVLQEINNKELELEKNRTAIVLSQIQPHFLSNCLVSIKQLCDIDPKKASIALEHFSYYLRENLYLLSNLNLIPFEYEINHLKNYIYLEKLRFEERLNIEWMLMELDFVIPSMTLQPLVENALHHGIMKKKNGGTIIIKSEKVYNNIVISIHDDGIGFDTSAPFDKRRPHIGLENVRKRIAVQCNGEFNIHSIIEKGTIVEIILPQKQIDLEKSNL